jgi:hypothetical protein
MVNLKAMKTVALIVPSTFERPVLNSTNVMLVASPYPISWKTVHTVEQSKM